MTTMWLILASCDSPRSDSDPAAGSAVSASNDASAAGTMIRARELIKSPPPLTSPDPYSLASLLRDPMEEIKKVRLRLCRAAPSLYSVPDRRRRRGQVDAFRHLHRHRGGRRRGSHDGGGSGRSRW